MMWVKNAGTYTKGVTLLPNAILDPSPDNDVYIITSNRLDNLNRALNFGLIVLRQRTKLIRTL